MQVSDGYANGTVCQRHGPTAPTPRNFRHCQWKQGAIGWGRVERDATLESISLDPGFAKSFQSKRISSKSSKGKLVQLE